MIQFFFYFFLLGVLSRAFPVRRLSFSPKGTSFSEAAASLSPGARRGSPALATPRVINYGKKPFLA